MIKASLEKLLFASRWLLAPFYIALVFALLALLAKVGVRVYNLATQLIGSSEESVLLATLGIVDLTLSAFLIVVVILSGYSNFITRVDADAHADWPRWIAAVQFGELKFRLMVLIAAISAIKLLEAYMDVDLESGRDLAWETGVFGAFVVSALVLALTERIGRRPGAPR